MSKALGGLGGGGGIGLIEKDKVACGFQQGDAPVKAIENLRQRETRIDVRMTHRAPGFLKKLEPVDGLVRQFEAETGAERVF